MWINYNSKIAPKNKYTSAKSEIAILFWYPHAQFEQSWEDILYTGSVSFLSPGGFHGQEATLGLTVGTDVPAGMIDSPFFVCLSPSPSSLVSQVWTWALLPGPTMARSNVSKEFFNPQGNERMPPSTGPSCQQSGSQWSPLVTGSCPLKPLWEGDLTEKCRQNSETGGYYKRKPSLGPHALPCDLG